MTEIKKLKISKIICNPQKQITKFLKRNIQELSTILKKKLKIFQTMVIN